MLIQKLVFALILFASSAFAQITPPPSGGGGGGGGCPAAGALGRVQLYATSTTCGSNANFVYSTAANTLTNGATTVSAGIKVAGTGAFANYDGNGSVAAFWAQMDSNAPWAFSATLNGVAGGFGEFTSPPGIVWNITSLANQGNQIELTNQGSFVIVGDTPGDVAFEIEANSPVVNNMSFCASHPASVDIFTLSWELGGTVCANPVIQYTSGNQVIFPQLVSVALLSTSASGQLGAASAAVSPIAVSATGAISCATCATTTNGGALSGTAPVTISAAGVIACATCATTTNGGALSATLPITISAAGVIAANATTGTGNTIVEATNPTFVTDIITPAIFDSNGNVMLAMTTTASAVDGFTFTNAATANPGIVQLAATGTDSNITMKMLPKGTGIFNVGAGTLPANTGELVVYRTGTPTGIVIAGGSTEGAPTTSTDGVMLVLAHNAATNRQILIGDSAATINSTNVGVRMTVGSAPPIVDAISLDGSTGKSITFGTTAVQNIFRGSVPWLQGSTCSFIGPTAPSSNTCTGTYSSFDSTASTGATKITFGNDGSGSYTGTHSSTTTTQFSIVDGLVQSTTNQLQGQGSTGTVGWALNGAGKMKTYQALATVGPGVAPIYGNVSTTGNTAAITTSTLCAAAVCTGGEYVLHVYTNSTVTCGTPGPAAVGLNLTWTDDAGTKTTQTIPLDDNNSLTFSSTMALGDTTTYAHARFSFWSTGANAIQYATTYTACTTGTGTYSIRLALEQQI